MNNCIRIVLVKDGKETYWTEIYINLSEPEKTQIIKAFIDFVEETLS
jgi:hypothetical protein